MSMEEYLVDMKETIDSLEDVNVALPEDIVVWITINNLFKEYDITKWMILNEKLPCYTELEMRLLSEEMSQKVQRSEIEHEALLIYRTQPQ